MSSYRRYVAQHGAAVHRAREMIERHRLESPPVRPVAPETWAEETFQGFVRRLHANPLTVGFGPRDPVHVDQVLKEVTGHGPTEPYGLCPDCLGPKLAPGLIHQCPADPVLAYRGNRSGALRCPQCAGPKMRRLSTPVTSDDLPDGGLCRICERDLLIVVSPATGPGDVPVVIPDPHCSICKHVPHGGEAGCHCGCRGQR